MPTGSARPRATLRRRCALVGILAVLIGTALSAPAPADHTEEHDRQQLEETERRTGETGALIDEARATDAELEQQLADAIARRHGQEAVLDAAQGRLDEARAKVTFAEEQIAATEAEIRDLRAVIEARAVSAYKHGGATDFGVVLSSEDVNVAMQRATVLDKVFAHDRELLDRLRVLHTDLEDARRLHTMARDEAQRSEAEAAAELGRLLDAEDAVAAAEDAQNRRLAALEGEYQALLAQDAEIRSSIAAREAMIATLLEAPAQDASRRASLPLGAGGSLSTPTSGVFTSAFGPRDGRLHAGIDIANSVGTPVSAAGDGVVLEAGDFGGYGQSVLIGHAGGIATFYAHLSSIAVSAGQTVGAGEYIGAMGNTGSSTGPHLHFEVRVNGSPVDPMTYL